ncbi:MAG TPA: NADH-quinone oxidoreductase subunit J [Acidobacteriaceae bacterium]|jgi:NADH-quinone oxidoreductase subunit J|nr:NADH-quinone oxidoreductase subunit J [Acidobacteriaceae bacterium]
MTLPFLILALLTLAGGIAAMTLRRLVHCALALTIAFIGLAALYLNLGAEFAGLAQLLVYVGAIAILIVFVILLTRGDTDSASSFSPASFAGVVVALAVFAVLAWAVETSSLAGSAAVRPAPSAPMQQIGLTLMQHYVLPLEVIALMLTAAMIGAVILALRDKRSADSGDPARPELRA